MHSRIFQVAEEGAATRPKRASDFDDMVPIPFDAVRESVSRARDIDWLRRMNTDVLDVDITSQTFVAKGLDDWKMGVADRAKAIIEALAATYEDAAYAKRDARARIADIDAMVHSVTSELDPQDGFWVDDCLYGTISLTQWLITSAKEGVRYRIVATFEYTR